MRILVLAAQFPHPKVDHSGGTDLFHYIVSLSRRHEVTLLARIAPDEEPHRPGMEPYCAAIETVSTRRTLASKFERAPVLLAHPLETYRARSREFGDKLDRLCRPAPFDVVFCEHMYMANYLRRARGGLKILDEIDVLSRLKWQRLRAATHPAARVWAWFEWRKTVNQELRAVTEADLVFTRSESDRRFLLERVPGKAIRVLPPWFEGLDRYGEITPEQSERETLLFVGNMARPENIEAAAVLARDVLPRVRASVPTAQLWIVGARPAAAVQRLAELPGVTVTGFVPELAPYYARCRVFVAPLRMAGGIIVKILDALAAGRPVVASTPANEGIGASPGREIALADTPAAFAEQTIALLRDEALWQQRAAAGRAFIRRTFDWSRVEQTLEEACAGARSASGNVA